MRKLVTIRTISDVQPIEGADAIEVVKIDGWQCVAKKGEFHQGDKCVYHEVDSFLPEHERYAFMAGRGLQTNGDGGKGYRLRTIKLRGQLSQGLALPMADFPEFALAADDEDLAQLIGVTKWEPALPVQLAGQAKGTFPGFLNKTDQERIQNVPWILNDRESTWEVTQKLDGASMTVFWNQGEFGVCSRNLDLKETEGNTFWQVANRYGMRDKLESLGENIALQGELIGPGIQGNPHGLSAADFYLFDIWLIDEQRYATPNERASLTSVAALSEIKEVPVVEWEIKMSEFDSVDDILKFAEQVTDALNASNKAPEGVVFKRTSGGESFKAISTKYLLAEK